ncbi:hypothetical protein ACFW0U_17105 [Streptomyces albidoflavus]
MTARALGRLAAAAVVAGILAVVVSGHDGGRTRPADPPASTPHDHGSG